MKLFYNFALLRAWSALTILLFSCFTNSQQCTIDQIYPSAVCSPISENSSLELAPKASVFTTDKTNKQRAICVNNNCVVQLPVVPCALNATCAKCGMGNCVTCNSCPTTNKSRAQCCNAGCNICAQCPKQESPCQNGAASGSCDLPPVCRASISGDSFLRTPIRSVFIPRSMGANTARELVGWQQFIHRFAIDRNYITTGQSLGYYHSLRAEHIATALFGSSILNFAGSQVTDRTACELLADNFGLSTTFRGSLHIHPVIQNIFLDNQIFIGLDNLIPGLYIKAHTPIVNSRWRLHMSQVDSTVNSNNTTEIFPACYMSGQEARATNNIICALSGDFTFGAVQEKWRAGKFSNKTLSLTGLADIDVAIGWDFVRSPFYHVSVFGQIVIPTGNTTKAHYIFEPMVGNGKHWEIGGGATTHLVVWEGYDGQTLAIYLEGLATHMFKNTQCRSFDFCANGPLSRYLLLKEFESDGITPTGRIINAINLVTRPAYVSRTVKGDASIKLSYSTPCFTADLGYNFYGHTGENIEIANFCSSSQYTYGIKGTEGTCALEYETVGTMPAFFGPLIQTIPLNATQSKATIRSAAPTNNPQEIAPLTPDSIVVTALSKQTGIINAPGVIPAQRSNPPVLVSLQKLNKYSGASGPSATHKIFAYAGYNFTNCTKASWIVPYVGLGTEIEFEALACQEGASLSQWSIFVKGGAAF